MGDRDSRKPAGINKSVREFDEVTLDRIKRIDVQPDFEVWKEYAYEQGIHPAVISYLELRRKNFYRMENTVDGQIYCIPAGFLLSRSPILPVLSDCLCL